MLCLLKYLEYYVPLSKDLKILVGITFHFISVRYPQGRTDLTYWLRFIPGKTRGRGLVIWDPGLSRFPSLLAHVQRTLPNTTSSTRECYLSLKHEWSSFLPALWICTGDNEALSLIIFIMGLMPWRASFFIGYWFIVLTGFEETVSLYRGEDGVYSL